MHNEFVFPTRNFANLIIDAAECDVNRALQEVINKLEEEKIL